MFVQLSVAGVVVLFILTGVFIPDEYFQIVADEIMYEDNDENGESVTYWRKTLGSLDVTLAASAGLGTILTAILSFRFGQGKWADWNRRFQNWIGRRPQKVKVIMQPSNFSFESRDNLTDQFQEATDTFSSTTAEDCYSDGRQPSENFDTASNFTETDKNTENNTKKLCDIDEIINASNTKPSVSSGSADDNDEPKYKTLEARLIAVEGSLMRDIDSRMKVFEQQLEEFRSKMRGSNDKEVINDLISAIAKSCGSCVDEFKNVFDDYDQNVKPSSFLIEDVTTNLKASIPTKRYTATKPGSNAFSDLMADVISSTESKENLSTVSEHLAKVEASSSKSSQPVAPASEILSETGSIKKFNTPSERRRFYSPPTKSLNKAETKSDQTMRQGTPAKQPVSSNTMTPHIGKNTTDNTSPTRIGAAPRRTQPRSRQQMRAILQQTNEKLQQRSSKTRNANRV